MELTHRCKLDVDWVIELKRARQLLKPRLLRLARLTCDLVEAEHAGRRLTAAVAVDLDVDERAVRMRGRAADRLRGDGNIDDEQAARVAEWKARQPPKKTAVH